MVTGELGMRKSGPNIITSLILCHQPAGVVLLEVSESDDTVWRISAVAPSPVRTFVIGRTPEGFAESVPFIREPAPGERYVVDVSYESREQVFSMRGSFDIAELAENEWTVNRDERLSDAEFEALDPCDD